MFGGGTDYPAWFAKHGGAVVGTAIDKYCYISVRSLPPFFEHRHRIVYSVVELVREISEIRHPAVRGVLTEMGVNHGLEIHYDADLPARSGLGSSSSFTVGLLNALHAMRGRMMSKTDMSTEAIRIEQEVLKENVGCQDQIWAAHGGFNRIDFRHDGSYSVTPMIMPPERQEALRGHTMLFFTGFSRFADKIAKDQIQNFDNRTRELSTMRELVDRAIDVLTDPATPLSELGELMHESWLLKRSLANSVSTPEIDEIYDAGRDAGAIGGKLLGAGGGGFMLLFVPIEMRQRVRERLSKLIHVAFDFDFDGSKIVLYQPNGLNHV